MKFNLFSLILLFCLLFLGITAFFVIKKYYNSYNLLRLDPLEESKINTFGLLNSKVNEDIWLLGDSRIARWDKNLLSPLNVRIENFGIEGQTSSQVLNRLKNYLETGNPKWIFLEVGINDLKIIGLEPKLVNSIKDGCFGNITSIINLCEKKNINVIVLSIFKTGKIEPLRRFVWNSTVDSSIIQLNERLKSYCLVNNCMFFDANEILSDNGITIKNSYQDGFLHINKEAYKALSANMILKYGSVISKK